MAIIGRKTKQPGDTRRCVVSFADWFADRTDAPASYTVAVDPGVTVAGDEINGSVVTVWISGGVSGTRYKVTVALTTTSTPPAVKEVDFYVIVKED